MTTREDINTLSESSAKDMLWSLSQETGKLRVRVAELSADRTRDMQVSYAEVQGWKLKYEDEFKRCTTLITSFGTKENKMQQRISALEAENRSLALKLRKAKQSQKKVLRESVPVVRQNVSQVATYLL